MKKNSFYFIFILTGLILAFLMRRPLYTVKSINYKAESPFNEQTKVIAVPHHAQYDYVEVSKEIVYTSGYAANHSSQGTKFATEEGFHWTEGSGTHLTAKNTGHSFGSVDPLGEILINVPNKTDYFRLKVEEGWEVTKTAVYMYSESSSSKKFLYYIYPSTLYNRTFTPVVVN
ncbi:MAG: hypothetical protein WA887_06920 [Carnobacterium jeotgali]|uniref:hypothetical protein n=1 Tax=Carnobacterium jeotgali TaxID=545534 RepID=UPI003C7686ED